MKRLLAMILCTVMLLCQVSAFAVDRYFADAGEWAKADVVSVCMEEMNYGIPFKDYQSEVSREEFCDGIIGMYFKLCQNDKYGNLKKVSDRGGKCFADAFGSGVGYAHELGFVEGVGGDVFLPQRKITRQEAAVILNRLIASTGYELEGADLSLYADHDEVTSWAKEAVEKIWAFEPIASILNNDEINPQGTITREQLFAMMWRTYSHLTGIADSVLYEDTERDILVELGIVSAEDLKKSGNIKVTEALETIFRAGDMYGKSELKEWYFISELEQYDYIDEEKKSLLLSLTANAVNPILTYSEFSDLKYDQYITRSDAYLYISRLLMDSSGCSGIPHNFLVRPENKYLYEDLYEKGIIESAEVKDENKPIPRQEFYDMLHKAVFCIFVRGGYTDRNVRLFDMRMEQVEKDARETEIISQNIELSNVIIHDDLSITWEGGVEYYFMAEFLDKDGNVVYSCFEAGDDLFGSALSQAIYENPHNPPVKVRCIYSKEVETQEKVTVYEYCGEFDLGEIIVVEEGEAPVPGVMEFNEKGDRLTRMTLAEGEVFEEGEYYLIRGQKNIYRKPEFNTEMWYSEILSTKTGNEFDMEGRTIYFSREDDHYIRKISTEKCADGTIKVVMSPESKEKFDKEKTVEE